MELSVSRMKLVWTAVLTAVPTAVLTAVSTAVVTAVSAVKTAVSTAVGTAVAVRDSRSFSGRASRVSKYYVGRLRRATTNESRVLPYYNLYNHTTTILQPHTTTPYYNPTSLQFRSKMKLPHLR